MATFVRTTATPALLTFMAGFAADIKRHPYAGALLGTFGMVCLHAATYTPF